MECGTIRVTFLHHEVGYHLHVVTVQKDIFVNKKLMANDDN